MDSKLLRRQACEKTLGGLGGSPFKVLVSKENSAVIFVYVHCILLFSGDSASFPLWLALPPLAHIFTALYYLSFSQLCLPYLVNKLACYYRRHLGFSCVFSTPATLFCQSNHFHHGDFNPGIFWGSQSQVLGVSALAFLRFAFKTLTKRLQHPSRADIHRTMDPESDASNL